MDYLLYEAEDFASDESYLKYYFRLNDADVAFWEGWISHHPERLDIIINADHLISFLSLQLPENEFQEEFERMRAAIREVSDIADQPSPKPVVRLRPWLIAATVMTVLTAALYFLFFPKPTAPGIPLPLSTAGKLYEKTNTSAKPLDIQLEDGSLVTLLPGGKLMCPNHFPADKREVYLEGEAFFSVSKNVQRPFYVYYDNLVTHVLGTSFSIKTDKQKKQIEVAVRTGKVEVYKRSSARPEKELGDNSNGVILTPNQRVIYREEDRRFETSLVEKPQPVLPDSDSIDHVPGGTFNLAFNAIPLSDILHSFEKIYRIDIEVENENINHCHFSGDVSNMNLYDKLDVICKSLNASYEVIGTKILIRGKGCDPATYR